MKYRIGIIICYFGKLPDMTPLWLESCARNKAFDFLIYTDQEISCQAPNIHVHTTTLPQIAQRIKETLGLEQVGLYSAYKLCDFKPMYGEIFAADLVDYDFWGMCDLDVIFGQLDRFITEEILDRYEKVYQLGHLTLYKNVPEVNGRFRLDGHADWKEVAQTARHCKLCERGMIEKYRRAGIPVYDVKDYADVSKIHRRYQLSRWLVPSIVKDRYKHQLFYCDRGRIYRAVYEQGYIFVQEFNYIHLQKRRIVMPEQALGDCYGITKRRRSSGAIPIRVCCLNCWNVWNLRSKREAQCFANAGRIED